MITSRPLMNGALDLQSHLLFRQAQLVALLQIEPEFGACPKPLAEPERGVRGDRSFPRQNLEVIGSVGICNWRLSSAALIASSRS